jgi:hypothetical protein
MVTMASAPRAASAGESASAAPSCSQRFGVRARAIVYSDMMAGAQQVARHGRAHVSGADECEFHGKCHSNPMDKPGIAIDIPGFGKRHIRLAVSDYTGTHSCGG